MLRALGYGYVRAGRNAAQGRPAQADPPRDGTGAAGVSSPIVDTGPPAG